MNRKIKISLQKSLPPLNKPKANSITRVSSDKNLVNLNDYKLIGTINRGGFGIISLVKHKKSGEEYAANLITTKSQNKKFVSREVRILSQMQHATMIRFRGFSYVDFQGEPNITSWHCARNDASSQTLCNSQRSQTGKHIVRQ